MNYYIKSKFMLKAKKINNSFKKHIILFCDNIPFYTYVLSTLIKKEHD